MGVWTLPKFQVANFVNWHILSEKGKKKWILAVTAEHLHVKLNNLPFETNVEDVRQIMENLSEDTSCEQNDTVCTHNKTLFWRKMGKFNFAKKN